MAGDPISSQFGALEKLIKESAEADMKKKVALTRYQLGQAQAKIMAQQELEQGQAEMQAGEQAAQQQPTAPFQIQLPENGAMAERPVQWKNPLSQIAGNAFSQMAQNGVAGIQEALRATAGATPGAEQAMTQGLPMAGPTVDTSSMQVSVAPRQWGSHSTRMMPQITYGTQSQENALGAGDQANLRAAILDRMLQIQAAQKQGGEFNPKLFEETRQNLTNQYKGKVPAKDIAAVARATAVGDMEQASALLEQFPAPQEPYDPTERMILGLRYRDEQKTFATVDAKITGTKRLLNIFSDAERVLREAKAKTGLVEGSSLGQIIQRLNVMGDQTSVNILQQAFGEQFLQAMQSADFKGSFSEKEGERVAKTTGDFNKSVEFNLKDLRTRLAITKAQIKQHENERKASVGAMRAIEKRIGAEEYLPPAPERVEPDFSEVENPPEEKAQATGDTVALTVDGRRANVPADKVEAFMKRYPNAQRVQ